MNLVVKKTNVLQGTSQIPASKSHSIRAIFLGMLCIGESIISNVLHSDDIEDAINICRSLGVKINKQNDTLIMHSTGLPLHLESNNIFSGNSGITTHFALPLLGLRDSVEKPVILNCGEQMRERPIKPLVDALSQLGLNFNYVAAYGSLPVSVTDALVGGKIVVDGSTSQHVSAMLMALPCALDDSEIVVNNLSERPYVEMTLRCLQERGIHVTHKVYGNTDTFNIQGRQQYQATTTTIQGDFSSASYLIAASAIIPGETSLQGLNMGDPQGDKKLISILQEMGADIIVEPSRILIRGGKRLTGIKIDAHDIPDLVPTLAVIGTYTSGTTEITHATHARIKETDRLHSMTEGLTRMGAEIEEHLDGLTIYQSKLKGALVNGYNDHRTVMALSIAGMIADGETIITDSSAINKTFPTFIKTMQLLGARMELADEAFN